jgi:uncharacterized paraquat-inducible protein A
MSSVTDLEWLTRKLLARMRETFALAQDNLSRYDRSVMELMERVRRYRQIAAKELGLCTECTEKDAVENGVCTDCEYNAYVDEKYRLATHEQLLSNPW